MNGSARCPDCGQTHPLSGGPWLYRKTDVVWEGRIHLKAGSRIPYCKDCWAERGRQAAERYAARPDHEVDEKYADVPAWCSGCQTHLPRGDFARSRSRPNGLQSKCRECSTAYMAAYRARKRGG